MEFVKQSIKRFVQQNLFTRYRLYHTDYIDQISMSEWCEVLIFELSQVHIDYEMIFCSI